MRRSQQEAAQWRHLRRNDGELEDAAGLAQLEEGEEVHPLVLRLLQQRVDPAVVAVHAPERAHVAEHASSLRTSRRQIIRIATSIQRHMTTRYEKDEFRYNAE